MDNSGTVSATVIPRNSHSISRQDISENALKVLYRLNKSGFDAYLVGGGVRDLLLERKPKDFDIATNATPDEVRKLFRNCRLVGRRFRLAHIMFGPDIIEVATFRGPHDNNEPADDGKARSQQGKTACCCAIIFSAPLKKMPSAAISPLTAFITAWLILPSVITSAGWRIYSSALSV